MFLIICSGNIYRTSYGVLESFSEWKYIIGCSRFYYRTPGWLSVMGWLRYSHKVKDIGRRSSGLSTLTCANLKITGGNRLGEMCHKASEGCLPFRDFLCTSSTIFYIKCSSVCVGQGHEWAPFLCCVCVCSQGHWYIGATDKQRSAKSSLIRMSERHIRWVIEFQWYGF